MDPPSDHPRIAVGRIPPEATGGDGRGGLAKRPIQVAGQPTQAIWGPAICTWILPVFAKSTEKKDHRETLDFFVFVIGCSLPFPLPLPRR